MKEKIEKLSILIESDIEQMLKAASAIDKKLLLVKEILSECKVCKGLYKKTLTELYAAIDKARKEDAFYLESLGSAVESGAIYLSSIYQGMETVIHRILEFTGEGKPAGERWHQDLLILASRQVKNVRGPILSEEFTDLLKSEFLGFRHLIRKQYPFILDIGKTISKMKQCRRVVERFRKEAEGFLNSTRRSLPK